MVQEGEMALNLPQEETFEPFDSLAVSHSIIAGDTLAVSPEPEYGLLLTPPETPTPAPMRVQDGYGISFILSGLFILFLIISLRFRNNMKYAVYMFRNLLETRTRHNVFDDTVRETAMIVMLNLLWCACAGIIAFTAYSSTFTVSTGEYYRSLGMIAGMIIAVAYTLLMWGAYSLVGWIFSDTQHAALWVKGFTASQALMAPALFVIALLGICQPSIGLMLGMIGAGVFILGKLMFIWKGYRIFFNQISSWVLFLCYLCSLEIVPLILCYRSAVLLGEEL